MADPTLPGPGPGDNHREAIRAASRDRPCPVCGGDHKCGVGDGGLILCGRRDGPVPGFRHLGPSRGDPQFHLYRADDGPPAGRTSGPKPDWPARAAKLAANLKSSLRDELAAALGLSAEAIDALPGVGYSPGSRRVDGQSVQTGHWTFPERDAGGVVIGILRRFRDGTKKAMPGGRRGLTIPAGWRDRSDPVLLVEGPSDTLALTACGLAALGRPSNTGGVELLAALLAALSAEREVVVLGENDRKADGTWPGRDGATQTAAELSRRLGRPVCWALPPDGAKDARAWIIDQAAGSAEAVDWLRIGRDLVAALRPEPAPDPGPPVIQVGPDEGRVNDEAAAALARADGVYQRGGLLAHTVTTVRQSAPETAVRRPAGSVVVRELPAPLLRDRLARVATWVRPDGDGGVVPAHPPGWCVQAVHARGAWPGVPHLEAVVTHPVLLPDGSLLAESGYHRPSGLLVALPPDLAVAGPDSPTRSDAAAALDVLRDAISEFPFEAPAHRAGWLAGLLTPLAWFAFDGPAPLFLIDANVRAAGKGLLADVIALTVLGRRFSVMSYTPDREELRKRITSLVIEGERLVLLDNLAGSVGNDVLDAALTGERWKDRVLGGNRVYDGPLHVAWYGTGNNVQLGADTARRVCHVRIERPEERPELKGDYRRPDLRRFVRDNRGRLLAAALTLLRAWVVAGRPRPALPAWGSYEGWSDMVRSCVVWAGEADPGDARLALQSAADRDAGAMAVVLAKLRAADPDHRGRGTADIIELAKADADLRAAVEDLVGRLDSRHLGYKLRSFKRRLFSGWFLDHAAVSGGGVRWAAFPADAFRRPSASPPSPPSGNGDGGDEGDAPAGVAPVADLRTLW